MKSVLAKSVVVSLGVAILGALQPASALEPAKGKVVLTITGKIGQKNTANAAAFDMAMIEKLPQQTFTTMTPWDKKPIEFTGPLLRDVLGAAKAQGSVIKAAALNDYQTTIPVEDAQKFDVVVAHKMNGANIPIKTKGPLFIVYPFDKKTELRSTVYYERSAWQLKSMVIE